MLRRVGWEALKALCVRDWLLRLRVLAARGVAMTCCQIRQGRDGQVDEDVENYLSSLSPCRSTKGATSNEFSCKLDWLGVCQKEKKVFRAERMDEWMTRN